MSVTLDASLLLYASDEASSFHERARARLEVLARGPEIVYLFWPVAVAYVRISTHPNVFEHPLPPERAIAKVEELLALPHVQTAGEQTHFWKRSRDVATDAAVRGNLVSDAHVVALMLENGVRSIWTNDRDYRRFSGVEVLDSLAE